MAVGGQPWDAGEPAGSATTRTAIPSCSSLRTIRPLGSADDRQLGDRAGPALDDLHLDRATEQLGPLLRTGDSGLEFGTLTHLPVHADLERIGLEPHAHLDR